MRTALLVLVLAMVMATGAFAVSAGTATVQLYGQLNQIAAPLVPFNPFPLYAGDGGNIEGCFAGWQELYTASDWVQRYDPTTGGTTQLLAEWDGSPTGGQGILAGDGYKAWVDGSTQPQSEVVRTFTYQGADISDTDLWVSLPGITGGQGGLHWVGITYPVGKTVDYLSVVVTDGSAAYTMLQIASGEGPQDWLDPTFGYYDATVQGDKPVPWEYEPILYGGQMYRVSTMKPNLALIIPHPL